MSWHKIGAPIQWRMYIPAPPQKVFDALNTNDGRAAFWAESSVERDGQIAFHFANGYRCNSEILERTPPYRFAIRYFGSPLIIELADDGAGNTDLLLRHEDVPENQWAEVHAGWLNVLFPLKAWVAYGIDLRNHDPKRSWDQGYADQ